MNLLVDIGNTRLKWLAVEAGLVVNRGHLLHQGIDPKLWGDRLWSHLYRPRQIVIANVAGSEIAWALDSWCLQHWALRPHLIHAEAERFGIRNAYTMPETLGVDRWAAMIGSHHLVNTHCTVVDCGTAVTIDALTANGQHLGGVIIPGLRLMHEALFRKTSQIAEQDMGDIVYLGRNTRDCIWGGSVYAITAAIDRITAQMAEQFGGGPVQHLLTGGNSAALMPFLQRQDYRLEPDLIFAGLRHYLDNEHTLAQPILRQVGGAC